MNLNKVFVIGRLAADPESRTTPSGQSVVTLRIATNRVWNNRSTGEKQEQVEFHTVIAWGGLGEVASKYLRKGQLAFFEGRLQTRSWQGQDGIKKYKTEIVAENLQLGPKAMNTGLTPVGRMDSAAPTQPSNPVSTKEAVSADPLRQSFSEASKQEDIPVINEDAPVSSDPIISADEIEEKEIDLKDIPF